MILQLIDKSDAYLKFDPGLHVLACLWSPTFSLRLETLLEPGSLGGGRGRLR